MPMPQVENIGDALADLTPDPELLLWLTTCKPPHRLACPACFLIHVAVPISSLHPRSVDGTPRTLRSEAGTGGVIGEG